MARIKMFAGRVAEVAVWATITGATLMAVHAGSAATAHLGTWIEWR